MDKKSIDRSMNLLARRILQRFAKYGCHCAVKLRVLGYPSLVIRKDYLSQCVNPRYQCSKSRGKIGICHLGKSAGLARNDAFFFFFFTTAR